MSQLCCGLLLWLCLTVGVAQAQGAAPVLAPSSPDAGMPVPPPRVTKSRWQRLTPEQREAFLTPLGNRPHLDRIIELSSQFLDTPYAVSPLGEGSGIDPDPPIRYDAVDCLTFVEEVLALSLSTRDSDAPLVLAQIRYGQHPTYEDRNHLMEAQWLPHNAAKGFIRDVTREYGGADVLEVVKTVTPATWTSKSSMELKLPPSARPVGTFPLQLLPLDKALPALQKVPSGTLMLVVRAEHPAKATRITHLGFVVQKDKQTFIRHASRNPFGRVVDEPAERFLFRNSRYPWKVEGVSLFAPLSRPR